MSPRAEQGLYCLVVSHTYPGRLTAAAEKLPCARGSRLCHNLILCNAHFGIYIGPHGTCSDISGNAILHNRVSGNFRSGIRLASKGNILAGNAVRSNRASDMMRPDEETYPENNRCGTVAAWDHTKGTPEKPPGGGGRLTAQPQGALCTVIRPLRSAAVLPAGYLLLTR